MNEDMQMKWKNAMELAKQSTGGSGVDAANVMISQLRAQKAVKKKSSTAAPPTPEVVEQLDPMEAQLSILGLKSEEKCSVQDVLKAYKKKVLQHASGKGGGKIETYTNAFVELVKYFKSKASDSGNVDLVRKCDSYLVGDIRPSSNIIILKIDQPGRVWKRVIKQKHPGAISLQSKNEESRTSSKFSTTWRPAGDYIHLKVTFLVQNKSIQVGGPSYLLWTVENFQEFNELAEKLAKSEENDKMEDHEKINAILKGLKYMKDNCEEMNVKLINIEREQNYFHEDQVNIDEKIDGLYVHLHEIRQVTGARCLADGHSAAFLINRLNKEAEMERELNNNNNPDDSIEDDIARKDSYQKEPKSKTDDSKQPPNVTSKKKYKRKVTQAQLNQINRMESIDDDSGFKSSNSSSRLT